MSVSDLDVQNLLPGNGSAVNFAINFDYSDISEIKVVLRQVGGAEVAQVKSVDYTLDSETAPTQVQMVVAPAAGEYLLIIREVPLTQPTSYLPTSSFPSSTHEEALDNMARQIQQIDNLLNRAVLLPESTPNGGASIEDPSEGNYVKWSGGNLVNTNVLPSGTELASQAEAEAGSDNAKYMSSLRTRQQVAAFQATETEAVTGTDDTKIMTPLKSFDMLNSRSDNSRLLANVSISAICSSNNLVIGIKQGDVSTDHTSASPGYVAMKDLTPGTSIYTVMKVDAAMSLTVPNGATLGTFDGHESWLYVYLAREGGTTFNNDALCISHTILDEGKLHSAVAISTGADSNNVIYSTNTVTNKTMRMIGRIKITQATAGTWVTQPSEVASIDAATAKGDTQISSTSFTMDLTASGAAKASSPDHDLATWSRDKDCMVIRYHYGHTSSAGAVAGAGNINFNIPLSKSADQNKTVLDGASSAGSAFCFATSVGTLTSSARVSISGVALLLWGANSGNSGGISSSFAPITDASITYSFLVRVPIKGWHC